MNKILNQSRHSIGATLLMIGAETLLYSLNESADSAWICMTERVQGIYDGAILIYYFIFYMKLKIY